MATFCNEPTCTIDFSKLKESRYLLIVNGKPLLPYRNEAGSINVHLARECQRQVKAGLAALPAETVEKLEKWVKHATQWEQDEGPAWTRRESGLGGFVWATPCGLRRAELRKPVEAEIERQLTHQISGKTVSRVPRAGEERPRKTTNPEMEERKRKIALLAAKMRGETTREERKETDRSKQERARAEEEAALKKFKRQREAEKKSESSGAAREAGSGKEKKRKRCKELALDHGDGEEEEEEATDEEEESDESDEEEMQALDQVIGKCDDVAAKMRRELASLVEQGRTEPETLPQPRWLTNQLVMAPHQLIGLSWLYGLRKHRLSGILADEMGLGKTVQTISLLAQLLDEGDEGPHLIVAPMSTVENWMRELAMWCPKLKAVKYAGNEAERDELQEELLKGELRGTNVVVTAFTTLGKETDKGRRERLFLQKKLGKCSKKGKLSYLIIDEAQQIKNCDSARNKYLCAVECEHRLLLTGTPVENSPRELLTLLSFLMPRLFAVKGNTSLVNLFKSLDSNDPASQRRAKQVKKIMGPFVLRRLKKDVLQNLPAKTEVVEYVKMPGAQKLVYAQTLQRVAEQARERKEGDRMTAGAALDSKWVTNAFTELRKAAHHPMLLQRHYSTKVIRKIASELLADEFFGADATFEKIEEELQSSSDLDLHLHCRAYPRLEEHALDSSQLEGSAKTRYLKDLLPGLIEGGHRALIFSQWTKVLDILGLLLEHLAIRYVRFDGSTSGQARQEIIDQFDMDPSIGVFLLSTRAGGLGINLTAADTVILHDVDFNPAMDQQAMDRCHRMGQTRPVRVIKLATASTVDEKVLGVAQRKLEQQAVLLGQGGKQSRDSQADADRSEGLMGSILREVLLDPAPVEDAIEVDAAEAEAQLQPLGASSDTPGLAAEAKEDVVTLEADRQPTVNSEHESDCDISTAEPANEVAAWAETNGAARAGCPSTEPLEADESHGPRDEAQARSLVHTRIWERAEMYLKEDWTIKQVMADLDTYFKVDIRALGLKTYVKEQLSMAGSSLNFE
mmetsp:Transcript_24426/g.58814  ORF Transcript_24426/g.58814 Transcript_24426/m.58814 type:complete len:1025 (+) Transcript_24426:139-3213(+)